MFISYPVRIVSYSKYSLENIEKQITSDEVVRNHCLLFHAISEQKLSLYNDM